MRASVVHRFARPRRAGPRTAGTPRPKRFHGGAGRVARASDRAQLNDVTRADARPDPDDAAPDRRARECDAAWARHRPGDDWLTARASTGWEAYHLRLLCEDAQRHGDPRWNTPRLRGRLSAEQNHRCCHCGKRMDEDAPRRDDRPSFEHILPRKQGGSDRPCNLAVACRRCNEDRAHRLGWRPATAAASG